MYPRSTSLKNYLFVELIKLARPHQLFPPPVLNEKSEDLNSDGGSATDWMRFREDTSPSGISVSSF